jgi:hypothetical protein
MDVVTLRTFVSKKKIRMIDHGKDMDRIQHLWRTGRWTRYL